MAVSLSVFSPMVFISGVGFGVEVTALWLLSPSETTSAVVPQAQSTSISSAIIREIIEIFFIFVFSSFKGYLVIR